MTCIGRKNIHIVGASCCQSCQAFLLVLAQSTESTTTTTTTTATTPNAFRQVTLHFTLQITSLLLQCVWYFVVVDGEDNEPLPSKFAALPAAILSVYADVQVCVVGDDVRVCERPSLPDLPPGLTGSFAFDSQKPYPTLAEVSACRGGIFIFV